MANQVYDDPTTDKEYESPGGGSPYDDQRAAGKPYDPRGHDAPAGDPSDPRGEGNDSLDRNDLKQAEDGGGLYNPKGDSGREPDSPESLRDSEDEAGSHFASGFESNQRTPRQDKAKRFVRRHRSKLLIAGGGLLGSLASVIISIMLFIPLKVEHMVQNLENRFTSPVTSAIDATNNVLLKKYIVKYVIPNYKNCGTTIDTRCQVRVVGGPSNPVTNLYRGWAKTRLETRLATKYGIELHYDSFSKTWLLKGPGTAPDGDNIGRYGERIDDTFGRKAFRNASVSALQTESQWKKVWYRFMIGSYMGRIDGVKRCIFFCGTREAIRGTIGDMKLAAKYWLAENVLQPRSELTAVAIKCLLDPSCQPDHTTAQGENPPVSDFEQQETSALESLAAENGVTDMAKLKDIHTKMSERGFQKYLTDQILQKVFSEQTSQKITDSIPIVGWINLAAEIVNDANNAGPKIKKITYVIGAAAAVKYFMGYQTFADEIHTGQVDPTEVGSMVDSLGPGVDNPNDPLVGGTAGAEQAPLYSDVMDGKPATGVSPDYKCKNGKPPAPDQACSEEQLGLGLSAANDLHDFLNQPGFDVITTIAQAWSSTIGQGFNLLSSVTGSILSSITPSLPIAAPKIVDAITNWLIPNPWGDNMGGGRSWTMLAQGAQVYGNTGCDTAGCQDVSGPVAAAIIKQQQEQDREQFASQPFFARMFSTDSSYSLVSQLAMATPLNVQASMQSGFASLLNDPFSAFTHSFGTIFSFGQSAASAAATPNPDPFNVGIKAFPTNKIPPDPEQYWDDHNCGDTSDNGPIAKWQQAAANGPTNPTTGMPMHTDVEPCLLIEKAVGAVGGKDDSSLLSADDLAGAAGTSAPAAAAPGGSTVPAGGVAFPFPPSVAVVPPSSWTPDQGVDISTGGSACGKNAPEVAMGGGVIVGRGINGFGPDAPILHVTDGGPLNDRYIYYGHAGDAQNSNGAGRPQGTEIGDKVTAGQVITYTGCGQVGLSSGPHLEIGIWPQGSTPSNSFPAMNQTSGEMMQILLNAYKAQGSK